MSSKNIEEAVSLLAGETFWNENDFDFAAEALWMGLRVRWCGMAILVDGGKRLHVLAYRNMGRKCEGEAYDIRGTPCEALWCQ